MTHNNNTIGDTILMGFVWLIQFIVAIMESIVELNFDDLTGKILRILQIIAVIASIYVSYKIIKKHNLEEKQNARKD